MKKASDILKVIQPVQLMGRFDGRIGRLTIDSRQVRSGDVFMAIPGTATDGHNYIGAALRNGAGVIIAERLPCDDPLIPDPESSDTPYLFIQVSNTRDIAGDLAQAFAGHPSRTMKMVGITGTNGKTTVATLVYQVLRTLGYNSGLLSTVDTRVGDKVRPSKLTTPDPVSLAVTLKDMVRVDTAFALMEVSSHALEQKRVNGIRFHAAAFTNISQDHLDYHQDMESYIEAKKKLFDMLDSRSIAIINRDDPASYRVTDGCRADIWEFGFRDRSDFRILDQSSDGMVLDLDGMIVSSPLAGRYNAYNVAQAYLICLALGCTKNSVAAALCDAPGAAGRLERVVSEASHPMVFVDYAHTPDALENVLKALLQVREPDEKVHVVFGCGGDRDRSKRPEMGHIADQYADIITLTSDNPRSENPDAIIRDIRKGIVRNDRLYLESDRRKAIRSAILESDTRTIVLIAGKGHEAYQEIHGRRLRFDDRNVASGALREWGSRRFYKAGRRVRTKNDGEN